jgi:uncharacterized tellurite resistance protein B-like protein
MSLVLRAVLFLCATIASAALLPGQAEARRGGGFVVHQQVLEFVSLTTLSDNTGAPLALCHLIDERAAFGVLKFTVTLEGYALATKNCSTDNYIPYSSTKVALAKARGEIPKAVPDEPVLTARQQVIGFAGWPVLAALLLFSVVSARGKVSGLRERRNSLLFGISPLHHSAIVLMAQAARADGQVTTQEVAMIARNLQDFTRSAVDFDTVAEIVELTAPARLDADLKLVAARRHSAEDKAALMSICVMMISADGRVANAELALLRRMAKALKLSNSQLSAVVDRVLGEEAAGVPA